MVVPARLASAVLRVAAGLAAGLASAAALVVASHVTDGLVESNCPIPFALLPIRQHKCGGIGDGLQVRPLTLMWPKRLGTRSCGPR
jgi:hypothetical protein